MNVWAYAPEADEPDHGLVIVSTDHGAAATLTPAQARELATELESVANHAEADVWTVTVAGRESLDGEKPYTYVVQAAAMAAAQAVTLAWHRRNQEDATAHVVESESFAGVPAADCGFHWDDLRQVTCDVNG